MITVFSPREFFIILILFFSLSSFANEGSLVFIKGQVLYKKNGQKNYKEAKKGLRVFSGDAIKTGETGLAIIKAPELTVKLMKNSRIRLAFKDENKTYGRLSRGGAVFELMKSKIVKGNHDRLQIRTKTASIGVRGTTFMAFNGKEKNSVLTVKEGEVLFQGEASERSISVGKSQTTLTNVENKTLRPRSSSLVDEVNWSFDTKKDLGQTDKFYSQVEKVWQMYKKEQEVAWKDYKKENEEVWNNFINN